MNRLLVTCLVSRTTLPNARRFLCHSQAFLRKVDLSYEIYEEHTPSTAPSPPIFICHGLFGNRKNWNSLSKRLNQLTKRTVISYDAVNHGVSGQHPDMSYIDMSKDLVNLMNQLDVQRSIIIGHSMGGKTVMATSLLSPERIEKLVVVDASPSMSKSQGETFDYMQGMKKIDMSRLKSRREVEMEVKKFVKSQFVVGFLMTNLLDKPHFRWRINLDALIENYHHIHAFPTFDERAVFKGPTQFIGGGRSDYISEEHHPVIKRRFPASNIVHIPEAGHWVHSEKPNEFLQIASDFINEN